MSSQLPIRILLVEDNPGDAELVRVVLERTDVGPVGIVRCDRAAEAVAHLQAEEFQLVLLDLGLPDAQGLEALQRVQAVSKQIPIIIMSALEDLDLSRAAIRHGAQDFLCKNHISGEFLVRAIRNGIERHQVLAAAIAGSLHDELTGLHNRRGLTEAASLIAKSAARLGAPLLLLYVDLDGLKQVNDTWGHEAGDQAIREAAAVLRRTFRDADVVARMGGDEFAVLAVGAQGRNCDIIRRRLDDAVRDLNSAPDRDFELSLSVGAVEIDLRQPFNLDELLSDADRRMYEEKRGKKARANVRQCAANGAG